MSAVFLSLKGAVIANKSHVRVSDIGSTEDTALMCFTEYYIAGDRTSGGNWSAPDGSRVNDSGGTGFRRSRGRGVVRLIRIEDKEPSLGIYMCRIFDQKKELKMLLVFFVGDNQAGMN